MRKNEIITERMIDEHIFREEALDDLSIESMDVLAAQIELEKVRIRAKLNFEKTRIEQETRLREVSIARTTQGDNNREFHIRKQVRLLPKFPEATTNEYFAHFERTALYME